MILLFLTPGPPRGGRSFASYAGLKLSKNSAPPFFPSLLPWGRKRLQNYSFFLYVQLFSQLFFIYFQIILLHLDYQRNTNTKKG